jgi:hypothetical protein
MIDEMKRLKEYKEQQFAIGHRDRTLKNGWRHGILGVENVDDPGSSTYNDVQ